MKVSTLTSTQVPPLPQGELEQATQGTVKMGYEIINIYKKTEQRIEGHLNSDFQFSD